MITQPNDFLIQAWKRQLDGCLRTYWRRFYEIGAQTQRDLAQCMVAAPATAPAAHEDSKQAVLTVIDQTYKQWLDATQQIYNLPQAPVRNAAAPK